MSSRAITRLHSKKQRAHEDRLAYIHNAIRTWRYPTVEDLMRETGVGRDAIMEDVKYLKEFWEFPLRVSRAKGRRSGYYYAGEVPEKIGFTFNESSVMNLAISQKALEMIVVKGEDRFEIDMDPISRMLLPHTKLLLDEVRQTVFFRPFAPEEVDVHKFRTLSFGVRKRREMEVLHWKNQASAPELKRVRGILFLVAANCWYMIGQDVEKNAFRTYLVSRLSEPVITDVRFKKPKFDLEEYLYGAFIVMKGDESHDIVLEFSPWARSYIEGRKFVRDQKVEVLPNGGLRVSFWLSCLHEVIRWVCWWGEDCTVIGSEGLKQRLRQYRDGHLGKLG